MFKQIFFRNFNVAAVLKSVKIKQNCCNLNTTSYYFKNDTSEKDNSEPLVKQLLEDATAFVDTTQPEDDQWATMPYPEGAPKRSRDQSSKRSHPKIQPEDTSVILFPGQGAQYVGMAKDLIKFPAVIDMFEYASEILQ